MSPTGEAAAHWQERANLLTPLAKAFSTDVGVDVASLGVQVHGGMGFIEETGAAALYRDARIAPIYEGTNGIQAIDLVARKLPLGGGEHVHGYIAELTGGRRRGARRPTSQGFGRTADDLDRALDDLDEATRFLQKLLADGRLGRGAGRRHALSQAVLACRRRRLSGARRACRRIGRASRSAASLPKTCLARRAP